MQGAFGVGMAGEQRHLCAVRRQLRPRALFVETAGGIFVGVVQDGEDGMLRLARLYPDLSLAFASGAAADLHQQLRQPFFAAVVQAVQRLVGIDDDGKVQAREVVPFGEPLGTKDDVHFARLYLCQRRFELAAGGVAVAVDAQEARLRELAGDALFEALRAEAEHVQAVAVAGGAACRQGLFPPAVVALQPVAGGVHGEHGVAGVAGGVPVAGVAAQERRVAAAVEKEQGLAAVGEGAAHGADEFVAHAAAGRCAVHVFQMDGGGRCRGGARSQAQMLPVAAPHLVVAFQRGRRRAEEDGDACLLRAF